MNLLDLSSTNRETHALLSTGGWVGTLPYGYTKTVDGKKFTVHTHPSEGQLLVHELPDGGVVRIYKAGTISWYDDRGVRHREDGPAVIHADGIEMWYHDNKIHREDGPAITRPDGTEMWYRDDELHREDGPAITWADGSTAWYYHGQRHREDGPAIVRPNGSTTWYYRGRRHREDGPAVVNADGTEEYYIHGKQVNKEDLP